MFQIGFSLFKLNLVDNSVTNNLSKPYCRQKKSPILSEEGAVLYPTYCILLSQTKWWTVRRLRFQQ